MCKVCEPVAHGVVTGWDGECKFRCDVGHYPSNGTCVACASAPACAVGFYIDSSLCDAGFCYFLKPLPIVSVEYLTSIRRVSISN